MENRMKVSLIQKAINLQEYLKETGTCHNKLYFEYDFGNKEKNIPIEVETGDNCTIVKCKCLHHSMHWLSLCSYSLGVIFYLFRKQMGKVKMKWQNW